MVARISSTVKMPWFHLDIPGVELISKSLHLHFIIGEEIEDFEELLRLIQHHVRRHNPSVQVIGLPALSARWQPPPARPFPQPRTPAWLRFEVPTRPRSLRGPLTTGLGATGLLFGLWQLATATGSPRNAVHLTLLAMIVLVLGVLVWLIDWTKSQDS